MVVENDRPDVKDRLKIDYATLEQRNLRLVYATDTARSLNRKGLNAEIEAVMSHGYRLMALLSAVQQMLARRVGRLDEGLVVAALAETAAATTQALQPDEAAPVAGPVEPVLSDWPEHRDQQDLTPWLLRRLRISRIEAAALTTAVAALLSA